MSTLTKIQPQDAASRIASGELTLIDVRDTDEYARAHARGAISIPLSQLTSGGAKVSGPAVFMCRSGNRTDVHCAALHDAVNGDGLLLDGGLQAWSAAGLPTDVNTKAPLEIMRQVQIAAGGLTLVGVVFGTTVHPAFYGLSAFVGAGLTFAGISGWCGMAKLLGVMPWNRTGAAAA